MQENAVAIPRFIDHEGTRNKISFSIPVEHVVKVVMFPREEIVEYVFKERTTSFFGFFEDVAGWWYKKGPWGDRFLAETDAELEERESGIEVVAGFVYFKPRVEIHLTNRSEEYFLFKKSDDAKKTYGRILEKIDGGRSPERTITTDDVFGECESSIDWDC